MIVDNKYYFITWQVSLCSVTDIKSFLSVKTLLQQNWMFYIVDPNSGQEIL